MLTGIGFTSGYIIYFRFIADDAGTSDWLFGISPEGIGMVGMLINFAVTLGVSRFTARPPEHVRQLIENIRLPG
jgi:cation/acetate symporter